MVKTKRTQVHTAGTVEARHCNPAVLPPWLGALQNLPCSRN